MKTMPFSYNPGANGSHHLSNGLSSVGTNSMGRRGKHKVKKK